MKLGATNAVLRCLLEGSIDYAGIFPPASLSLDQAARNFDRYRRGDEAWILSRFVCPVHRLDELADIVDSLDTPQEEAWPITVLGESLSLAKVELAAIDVWLCSHIDWASVDAYEVRASSAELAEGAWRSVASKATFDVTLELAWGRNMADDMHVVAEVAGIGVKARTGGATPESIPTSRDLASFLKEAIDLDLKFKLTAGLHHPVRQWNDELGAKMHGFLNVMFAGALIIEHELSVMETQHVLESEQLAELMGSGESLTYGGDEISVEAAEELRELFVGFGSCSVEEPLHDLATLGLLGQGAAV